MSAFAPSLTRALACVTLTASALAAQPPRPRTRDAVVSVVVGSDNRATVQARYEFTGNPGALSFEWLEQPCTRVGPVTIQSNGSDIPFAREMSGPWVRLHDTSVVDPGRSTLGYAVNYNVELLGRDVNIPVLVPVAVLAGRARGEPVAEVSVTLPPGARVSVPRMSPAGDGRWSARLVALPAAVRVENASPNADCRGVVAGDSGHFKLIFWALVATLALWVPTYLWWANRQHDAA